MKTKYIVTLCTPLLVFLFIITNTLISYAAETEYPEDIAARLQLRYDDMKSLTFNFNQDTRGEITGRPRKGSGTATFLKSNTKSRMRWDYLSPKKQIILNDGNLFYMYFQELQQMIISPAENLENDLTYSFFSGKGNLKNDFHIRPADPDFESDAKLDFKVIKLVPIIPHSQVQDIHLWVSADSLIRRIHIQDHFGTITVLNLSDINPDALEGSSQTEIESLFSFSPPEGTEIIQQ
ncbi:MAG: outer membrane lipoprotein carrier protein [Desulforhopalus sp.]|jgi:outer membrane lipoprotein carrier protein